ncbi:MAG: type II 3-dehydroquinate dehydratase [Gammaproteobacteria bacterium]|nr:type II 3-dehydroquinate dehydratase [Gammaproteobacteria bacterium]
MAQLLLLNGPNLNLLGTREPAVYGQTTLAEIEQSMAREAERLGHALSAFQSNAEHALIDHLHAARDATDLVLFNPGAFTHTSVALRDAFLGVELPFIELHLSNVAAREDFRQTSFFSDIAIGTIAGFGAASYELALIAADRYLAGRDH